MSQTGKQDSEEAPASPGALEKQLAALEWRRRVKARIHAALSVVFFIGMAVMLWMFFEYPSKATEAAGAAGAFGLAGTIEGLLTLSCRAEGRSVQACKEILKAKDASREQP